MIEKNDDSNKENSQQLGKQLLNCSNKSGVKILSIWGLYHLAVAALIMALRTASAAGCCLALLHRPEDSARCVSATCATKKSFAVALSVPDIALFRGWFNEACQLYYQEFCYRAVCSRHCIIQWVV